MYTGQKESTEDRRFAEVFPLSHPVLFPQQFIPRPPNAHLRAKFCQSPAVRRALFSPARVAILGRQGRLPDNGR